MSVIQQKQRELELSQQHQKDESLESAESPAISNIQQKQREPELSQQNQKGDGLERATKSSLQHISESLSKEEMIERSWDFLTFITEKVALLPQEQQEKIIQLGRQLSAAGTSYNHTIENPYRRKASPALEATVKKEGTVH